MHRNGITRGGQRKEGGDQVLEVSKGAELTPEGDTVSNRIAESSLSAQVRRSPSWVWAVLSHSFWFLDACCPLGWILTEKSCFYISLTERTWDESQAYCKSLSADLATFNNDIHYSVSTPLFTDCSG